MQTSDIQNTFHRGSYNTALEDMNSLERELRSEEGED